ncbi:hypothetical protein QZH41_008079 [Actinostola sp. cb2023]|nr:hypothetical protein QZH41_008079 [Actinostola sp. cb2023]
MGSSISGIRESTALSSFRSIITYKRYVDIYFQTTDEARAAEFHQFMNAAHPRLTFEMETPRKDPDGLSLSLLHFTVTISDQGSSSFEFYKKKAKKPIFVHYQSAIPYNTKKSIIINERNRINQRCSMAYA